MINDTLHLKGSSSRDTFKYLHKTELPGSFYALDADLELVAKKPVPHIVARLDFKLEGDTISFTEVIAYNYFIQMNPPIPVYIIEAVGPFEEALPKDHRFRICRYNGGDYRPTPPTWDMECSRNLYGWEGLGAWERELRRRRRKQVKVQMHLNKPRP